LLIELLEIGLNIDEKLICELRKSTGNGGAGGKIC
jgi:hypothetical protein